MARPPSIRAAAAALLAVEVEKLAKKAAEVAGGLDDKDISRLQKLLDIDNTIHAVGEGALGARPEEQSVHEIAKKALEDRRKNAPELHPRGGPKVTSGIYNPPPPKEG